MLRECLERECHELTPRTRCAPHTRTSSRNHGGIPRQQRGYDAEYDAQRATLIGLPCAMRLPGCTGISTTAQHEGEALIPACGHCNYADGARRARSARTRIL